MHGKSGRSLRAAAAGRNPAPPPPRVFFQGLEAPAAKLSKAWKKWPRIFQAVENQP
jgi:hypothetical protein